MIWNWNKKRTSPQPAAISELAKKQLDDNREIFNSLKEYDEGKKDISTTNVKRHLRDLQPSA